MKQELRSKYANLLADCIRIAEEETGRQWPETTIICVKSYSPLAELDEILGMKIFVMDMPSEYEFFVASRLSMKIGALCRGRSGILSRV